MKGKEVKLKYVYFFLQYVASKITGGVGGGEEVKEKGKTFVANLNTVLLV